MYCGQAFSAHLRHQVIAFFRVIFPFQAIGYFKGQPMPLTMRQRFSLARFLRGPGPETGPVLLDRRRVYILPTRQGLLLGAVLIAILLGAINYDNALAFVLVFLLIGLGVVSILHTWHNLQGLRVEVGRCPAVFAGEEARFAIGLGNEARQPRPALALVLPDGTETVLDVPPGLHWTTLSRPAPHRGRLALGQFGTTGRGGERGLGHDDFTALRPYHPGDSVRQVYWKAVARGQGMYLKQFAGEAAQELWLAWELLPGLPTEERLARLCRWILEADEAGLAYGLRLPERTIAPGSGPAQRRHCLEALALHGEQS